MGRSVEKCWGEVWESVWSEYEGYGERLEGCEGKCGVVWEEVSRGVGDKGKCRGRCGKVCWSVGKIKGKKEKNVGECGEVLEKVCQSVVGVG